MDTRRLLTIVGVVAAVPLLAMAMIGPTGGSIVLGPTLVVLAIGFLVVRLFKRSPAEVRWTGIPVSIDPALVRPAGEPARGSVARSLSGTEAKLLATSAWLFVGVGFCVTLVIFLGIVFGSELEGSWTGLVDLFPMAVHPLVATIVVAGHRAVTRGRRDGTEELFSSLPSGWDARTRAHLLTGWVGVLVAAAFVGSFLLVVSIRHDHIGGAFRTRELVALGVALLLPAGGLSLGVALGRWAPWALVPFGAVAAVGFVDDRILKIGGEAFVTDKWLSTFLPSTDVNVIFYDPPGVAQLVWFGSLVVAVGAIALLRGEHTRTVPITLAASLGIAALAAWQVVQPIDPARAQALADRVNDPASHQRCESAGAEVAVCAYPEYGHLTGPVAASLAPVVAALPEGAISGPVVFRQLIDGPTEQLPPEVARLLTSDPTDTDALRLRFYVQDDNLVANRLRLAARAADLPTELIDGTTPTVVAGQARGVVVLWLASQGMSAGEIDDLLSAEQGGGEPMTPNRRGDLWPGRCADEDPVLLWSRQDAEAARAVIAADPVRVRSTITGDWDRWTAPDSTTDELLAELGLPAVGPFDTIEPIADRC
jgi:hypothetical protein